MSFEQNWERFSRAANLPTPVWVTMWLFLITLLGLWTRVVRDDRQWWEDYGSWFLVFVSIILMVMYSKTKSSS